MARQSAIFLVLLAQLAYGDTLRTHRITYPEAAVILGDRVVHGRQVEVKSIDGRLTTGKLEGFSSGDVILRSKTPIALCSVESLRLIRKRRSRVQRVALGISGVALGFVTGAVIGGPIGMAGAEKLGLTILFAAPILGGVIGSRTSGKKEHTVYLAQQQPDSPCPSREGNIP